MTAEVLADPSLKAADSLRSLLVKLAAGLCAFTIVIYQSWFMPFIASHEDPTRFVVYALYGAVLVTSIAVLATRRDVRSKVLPPAIAAALTIAATALYPVGIAAKSYLITLFLGGGAIVLMLASVPLSVLRLSASVTALNALICLLDLFFAYGFTNTPGRAAGLAINPNVAAAGLLLGTAASYRAVSKKWRASFLVLVGAALLVTLSRSNLLVAFAAVAVPVVPRIWRRYRDGQRFQVDPTGWKRAFVVALVVLGAISGALTTNAYFRTAIDGSFAGILTAAEALDAAEEAIDTSLDQVARISATPPAAPVAALPSPSSGASASATPSASPEATPPGSVTKAAEAADTSLDRAATISASPPAALRSPSSGAPASAMPPASSKATLPASVTKMEALSERLKDEGKRNSIAARALFLERGLLAYREGGFFGRGLEEAHALVPHNTFVLFAIAFGHFGWLIPLGLAGFAFCFARDASDLPLGIAVVGVMLASHDILVTPSLFLPVAVGIGGMLAGQKALAESDVASWSFAFGTIGGAALFVTGCIAILFLTPPFAVQRLPNERMYAARGGYEILLPPPPFSGLFRFTDLQAPLRSEVLFVQESKASLQRVDWSPQAKPAVQPGEYTVRQRDTLLFAASDASDPRQNERNYEVGAPLVINPLGYILLGTIAAWSLGALAWLRRSHRRSP